MNQDPEFPCASPRSSTRGVPRTPPREEANKGNCLWGLETGAGPAEVGAEGYTGATLSGHSLDVKILALEVLFIQKVQV